MSLISGEVIDSLLNSGTDFNQFSFMSKESQKNNPISTHKNTESTLNINNNLEQIKYSSSSITDSFRNGSIPANFDWRNVSGVNYDSPIRKQGECGSCYAIAAISVVESRVRIKTNKKLSKLIP